MDAMGHYQAARSCAAGFDLSDFGKVSLRGRDRAGFLQSFTTNDVVGPGIGTGCEAFLTTAQARIVAWLRVALRPKEIYLTMEPGLGAKVIEHLQRFQIAEEVEFEERTQTDALWHLCGPSVADRLTRLNLSVSDWAAWDTREQSLGGCGVWLQRCDFLEMPGFFLSAEVAAKGMIETALASAQVPVAPPGHPSWTMLRLEGGTPAYGIDFDISNLPQEINRTERAISFTKGCYTGQETVARIRAYGHVNRLVVGVQLKLSAEALGESFIEAVKAWTDARLLAGEKEVGRTRSVAYSPRLGTLLSLALVRREHTTPGTLLRAVSETGESAAEVVPLPLIA